MYVQRISQETFDMEVREHRFVIDRLHTPKELLGYRANRQRQSLILIEDGDGWLVVSDRPLAGLS